MADPEGPPFQTMHADPANKKTHQPTAVVRWLTRREGNAQYLLSKIEEASLHKLTEVIYVGKSEHGCVHHQKISREKRLFSVFKLLQ